MSKLPFSWRRLSGLQHSQGWSISNSRSCANHGWVDQNSVTNIPVTPSCLTFPKTLPRMLKGGKASNLRAVQQSIHRPRPRFRFPGHKKGKLAVQSACKEVNLRNKREDSKLFEYHMVKHPFIIVLKIPGMKICHGVLNYQDSQMFLSFAQCHIDKAISLQVGECKPPILSM